MICVDLKIGLESSNDEWEYRLASVLKSNAVNSGQAAMLPWEELAYPVKGIPGAMAYGEIPEDILVTILAARDAARTFVSELGADRSLSLKDMQRIIAGRSKHLRALDRTFDLDLAFLEHSVEGIIRKKVHDRVLQSLPMPGSGIAIKQATCCCSCWKLPKCCVGIRLGLVVGNLNC